MAITLPEARLQVSLSTVVESSIATARSVRSSVQARKEAEFQRAIADGLSYEEQVKLREKQLEEEKKSSFSDPEYIAKLEGYITQTKQLQRFDAYRSRYAKAFAELNAGRINEEDYLNTLKANLRGVTDPQLRLEIQNDIASAERQVKQYKDNILANQVKRAQFDGTRSVLDAAIADVKTARSIAQLSNNEDDIAEYDATLAALESQVNTVTIQDAIIDFQATSATRGTSPLDKLKFLNDQLAGADASKPIRIGETTYDSASQFWTQERDGYLAGSSRNFGNFMEELKGYAANEVKASAVKFGYPTMGTLDSISAQFKDLQNKPELQPFLNQFAAVQSEVMSSAVDVTARAMIEAANTSLQYGLIDTQLAAMATRYGVDTQAYRSNLLQTARSLEESERIPAGTTAQLIEQTEFVIPDFTKPAGDTPAAPTSGAKEYTVKAGDSLSRIAQGNGMSLEQILTLNPDLRANPNLIRPGQKIVLGQGEPEPVVETPLVPDNKPEVQPTQTNPQITPPQQTPTATPTPVTPTPTPQTPAPAPAAPVATAPPTNKPASTYTGSSIVDYLKSVGQASSFQDRIKMASEKGIQNYQGTAQQNAELLRSLRGN